jgi:hypothetical protein
MAAVLARGTSGISGGGDGVTGRIISDRFALICPDGRVAGDGECECIYGTREAAEDELRDTSGVHFLDYLKEINGCDSFRVARVVLMEIDD